MWIITKERSGGAPVHHFSILRILKPLVWVILYLSHYATGCWKCYDELDGLLDIKRHLGDKVFDELHMRFFKVDVGCQTLINGEGLHIIASLDLCCYAIETPKEELLTTEHLG